MSFYCMVSKQAKFFYVNKQDLYIQELSIPLQARPVPEAISTIEFDSLLFVLPIFQLDGRSLL